MKKTVHYLKLAFVLVICAAVLMINYSPAAAADFKKEYKMQINVGPTFYWGMGAQKFADLVKQRTKGQINIKPYFGSALLKGAQLKSAQLVANGVIDCAMESTINISPVITEANIFSLPFFINTFENLDKMEQGQTGNAVFASMDAKGLVANGVIDCAMESTINISPVITEANIFSLPFFINTFENLDKMEQGQTGSAVFASMDAKGLVGLAWAENGFRQVTNSKREIRTPEDVKGLRLRVVGSPIFIDIFRQLGADPVNMNWGDAVSAFQQGVVDGQENPVGVLIPVQIYQYHKYATFWNYLVDPLIFYWNKKQWNSFPQDIQKIIKAAALEAGRFEIALCRAGLDGEKSLNILNNEFNYTMEVPEPVKFMESKGMTVTFLSDAERQKFIEATKPLYEKWVPKIGEDVYKKALSDMGK